jgi:very-short-patch-repair endonuclease
VSYWCNRCDTAVGPRKKEPDRYVSYEDHNLTCWPGGAPGIDYMECALCKFSGSNITRHIKIAHGLTREEYCERYGPTLAPASKKKYSSSVKSRECWITKKKEAGEDLSTYRGKMSRSVSHAIMSNNKERERRGRLIGELNKRQDFRDRSSKTAKVTSSREDILTARTAALARWRENNPEKFQETVAKCLEKKISKPERLLYELCKNTLGSSTTKQLQIQHPEIPTRTKRARVDIAHREKKILVEFDGPFHFKPILGQEYLELKRMRDLAVEKYAIEHGCLLIRVSYDTYSKGQFTDEAKRAIVEALQSDTRSAVIRIGEMF